MPLDEKAKASLVRVHVRLLPREDLSVELSYNTATFQVVKEP